LAHMAQCEQTTLYFKIDGEAQAANAYIDLSSALTAANRKQYHQVSSSGKPYCFSVMVTAIKGETTFSGLNSQFLICNAVHQTAKGWKAQMRHGGVKLRDLPSWGRRPRFGLETTQVTENDRSSLGVPDPVFEISKLNLQPTISPGGANWFSTYSSTDGTDPVTITYTAATTPGVSKLSANQITQVTITDGAGAESNVPLIMTGNGAAEFSVIREYFRARKSQPDVDLSESAAPHSQMLNLFSVAEEMSDDIVDAQEHYMDYKPYTPDDQTNVFDDLVEYCQLDSATTATTQYPPLTSVADVPLGLLKVNGADGNYIRIDVLSIYEM